MLHPKIDPDLGGFRPIGNANTSITEMEGGKIFIRYGNREVIIPTELAVALLLNATANYPKQPVEISLTTAWKQHAVQEVIDVDHVSSCEILRAIAEEMQENGEWVGE